MDEAIRECLAEEREFTFLGLLSTDCMKLGYAVDNLKKELRKCLGLN